jgi:hypothetical protein
MLPKWFNIIMVMYIVCKHMNIHGYPDIQWVWIWSGVHGHGYFHGWNAFDDVKDWWTKIALAHGGRLKPMASLLILVSWRL